MISSLSLLVTVGYENMDQDDAPQMSPKEVKEWKESKQVDVKQQSTEAEEQAKIVKRYLIGHYKRIFDLDHLARYGKDILNASPLFASLMAPLSTLYDVPGLSQRWYIENGISKPDPTANLALSALGLAFNVIANGLLVLRFSSKRKWWKSSMYLSTLCWIIKTIIAITNISVYGGKQSIHPDYQYTEAFWCAVFSAILAGVISVFLAPYAVYVTVTDVEDNKSVKVQGRHFMLSELGLFVFIALESLIISRIESWQYFDAVYFAVVSGLTVGFGDYYPTKAASKVLMFPFALVTIAGLATQVSAIISFFSERAQARKIRWRNLYEKRREEQYSKLHATDELIAEMEFLERLGKSENAISNAYDLAISLVGFLTFWFIGALAFSHMESWTYGESLYFGYVFFLTIGYGDYSPATAAGKVFFVTYSLVAVPIIASFAVQTVSNILTALNEARLEREKVRRGLEPSLDRDASVPISTDRLEEVDQDSFNPFVSHADLVVASHEEERETQRRGSRQGSRPERSFSLISKRFTTLASPVETTRNTDNGSDSQDSQEEIEGYLVTDGQQTAEPEEFDTPVGSLPDSKENAREKYTLEQQKEMLDEILHYAIVLEEQARKLMIVNLAPGSKARILLQADKNVMDRSVVAYEKDGSPAKVSQGLPPGNLNELEEIHVYRETFARLLVAGTRLKQLQGKEQLIFERRRGKSYRHGIPVEEDSNKKEAK